MVTSERRAAANRSNAQKSTGPRSAGGKARSALNALKAGVFARTPLLPGEKDEDHEAVVNEMIDDLAPATAQERELADRVAALAWRRRRLLLAEEGLLRLEIARRQAPPFEPDPERSDAENDAALAEADRLFTCGVLARPFTAAAGDPAAALLKFADQERRLNGSIDAALRMLIKLQDRRAKRAADGVAPNEPIPEPDAPAFAPAGGDDADTERSEGSAVPEINDTPAPNEPIPDQHPFLTAARRAELPPEAPKATDAPNDDIPAAPDEPIPESDHNAAPTPQPPAGPEAVDAPSGETAGEPRRAMPGVSTASREHWDPTPDGPSGSRPSNPPGHGSPPSRPGDGETPAAQSRGAPRASCPSPGTPGEPG